VRYHAARWAWVVGLALTAYLAFPSSAIDFAPLLEAKKVADRDVVAPFTFSVNKTDQELVREAEELASTVKPIYEFQQRALDSVRATLRVVFAALDAADQTPAAVRGVAQQYGITLTSEEASYLANGKRRRRIESALAGLFDRTLAVGVTAPGVLSRGLGRRVAPDRW
jgi:hypothetical protein